jgi:hypothetical protein
MRLFSVDWSSVQAETMQHYLEDVAKGFAQHRDQERLLESELHRFVRFNWELVLDLARAK